MEAKLVPREKIKFIGLELSGISRSISLKGLRDDIRALKRLGKAEKRAREILRDFSPDLAIGTGGYVCYPIMRQAVKLGVKTAIHESNSFPGLATKAIAPKMDVIFAVNEDVRQRLSPKAKVVVTGNPISEEVLFYDREKARRELGLQKGDICILSFGGSLGARAINQCIAPLMAYTKKYPNVKHIHGMGSFYTEIFPELLQKEGMRLSQEISRLDVREYINDMPKCLNAADIVISRAGAMTVSEVSACAKTAIFIPSPNVAENHQYYNAMSLGKNGGAVVIEEKNLSREKLIQEVTKFLDDPAKIKEMSKRAGECAVDGSNQKIYKELMKLLSKR
jgi:UDP-N-acetylglucosamine--N-acetylmuramyl-(pentapeptide) pyrophosphoryl-undecaprenol N-acetylglucosamine transferase